MVEMMNELGLASLSGFKSKNDDGIDTVSMLSSLRPWKPTEEGQLVKESTATGSGMWGLDAEESASDRMSSYIV